MSDTKPLVSIIIPCYNAEKFIEETILSVINQTYSPIEIIVVDDGSTDNSFNVISGVSNIKVLQQQNSGVSAARNLGFENSSGSFVCFLDADDWFFPNTILEKVAALQKNGAALVHGQVEVTDENLNPTGEVLIGVENRVIEGLLNYSPPAIPCPSNALIARWAIEECGLFDVNLSTSADYDMWLRIASKYNVVRVDSKGLKYRQHDSNMFSNLALQIHDMERIFGKYESELNFDITKNKFYKSIAKSFVKDGNIKKAIIYMFKAL